MQKRPENILHSVGVLVFFLCFTILSVTSRARTPAENTPKESVIEKQLLSSDNTRPQPRLDFGKYCLPKPLAMNYPMIPRDPVDHRMEHDCFSPNMDFKDVYYQKSPPLRKRWATQKSLCQGNDPAGSSTESFEYLRNEMLCSITGDSITEAWVRHYSSGLVPSDDCGYAIAVDAAGNVYVTGYIESLSIGTEYVTVKYNAEGIEQ